jgi:hypothetical protein
MENNKNQSLHNFLTVIAENPNDIGTVLDFSRNSRVHPRGHVSRGPTHNEPKFDTDCVENYSMTNPKYKNQNPKTAFISKVDQNDATFRILKIKEPNLKELFEKENKVAIEMSAQEVYCGEPVPHKVNEWFNGKKQHDFDSTPTSYVLVLIRDDNIITPPLIGFDVLTMFPVVESWRK